MANPNDRQYTNGEITVYWQPAECVHATTCFVKLRSVFNPGKRPWVNMNGASTQEIIDVVNLCPTDALTYKWNKDIENENRENDGLSESQETNLCITAVKDGPLICRGRYTISDIEGNEYHTDKVTSLCRCGHSGQQPYCDGRHSKVGFCDGQ